MISHALCKTRTQLGPSSSLDYIICGQAGASKLIGYWPLTWGAGTVYIWGVGVAQGHGAGRVATMFLYYTVGLVWWFGGVHCGDMEVMKAEG